ncbi:hypothetical protein [Gordonia liuliyuniae]|uniref:MT0933-like antitoxin protein n=1 Tax=Gordonia liuliyuniae TaxID=2911517 RepID=A0ABS9IT16_9ACTN|nr:hypothetical protein [Gordonia liuliyuniae]MCF8588671.1 hypothetical protein [Gordonia liuliyuniae]
MSEFIDKIKHKAEEFTAAIDNELTVLEGAGGDDVFAEHDGEDGAQKESAQNELAQEPAQKEPGDA